MDHIHRRIVELGLTLPKENPPAANYLAYTQVGDLIFISGQTCKNNGKLVYTEKLGHSCVMEIGKKAAELCIINTICQLNHACNGALSKVKRCIKIEVFIQSNNEFQKHMEIADIASDYLVHIFGNRGRHTRTVISCNSLPSNSTVEISSIFEIE